MKQPKHPSIIHKALHDAERKKRQKGNISIYIILVLLAASVASLLVMISTDKRPFPIPKNKLSYIKQKVSGIFTEQVGEFKQFESAEEFQAYVESANMGDLFFGGGFAQPMMMEESVGMDSEFKDWGMERVADVNLGTRGLDDGAGRVSDTNVQVVGIDEPDIIKTDGEDIYFSNNFYNYGRPIFFDENVRISPDIAPETDYRKNQIDIIKAWPPADLELKAAIEESGNLLLEDDILVIFANRFIYGYDVSNSAKPEKIWTIKYNDRTYLQAARLYNDEIYLITKNNIGYGKPCPFEPIQFGDSKMIVECTDIYHPIAPAAVDSTFVAMKVDLKTGEVKQDVSFVGSSRSSIVYMSKESLYVTYNHSLDMFAFMADFMISEMTDLLPADLRDKIQKLKTYDISSQSKMTELMTIFEKWQGSMDRDDMLKLENELENRMSRYYDKHFRKLYKTEIVKIDLDDFDVSADGIIPGYPLNQFAMDEYQGHLRIATTIGQRGGFWGFNSRQDSTNDVYVLDSKLKITGSVIDLGLTERIYSARFIGDRGYIVTFRQTDPFYVFDLSDPKNPVMTGELKIPGYSSYLHPVKDTLILGIGKEGSKVKLSLFDVSDPKNPLEIDKYTLDEYHSDALNNHHAFLMDAKHKVFFLPGSKGGYVFSYDDNKLEMLKAVGENQVKRALYLDNYLYVIANQTITILDMKNWVEVNEFDIVSQ